MLRIISTEYASIEPEIFQDFENFARNPQESAILVINNVPTIQNGLALISQEWLISVISNPNKNILGINFKVCEKITKNLLEGSKLLDLLSRNLVLVTFQSIVDEHESRTYWKIPESDNFYKIFIDNDETEEVTAFLQEFLVEEIKYGRTGILQNYQTKSEIRLREIGDNEGRNLLIYAVLKAKNGTVRKLLEHEFDPDDVIDLAWKKLGESADDQIKKEQFSKIILNLLKGNSRFPTEFDYINAPKKVQEFSDMCEALHCAVDNNNFEFLEQKLDEEPNLVHFYNRTNTSLLGHALKTRKMKILNFLNRGITTGSHEDLDEVYENLIGLEKKKLRSQHQKNSMEFSESHLLILRLKTRIGNNDRFSYKKWKYVEEAYETINSNEYCSKILKIAAVCKKLKIFFDFKHDTVYYLDPITAISNGVIYEGGSIYIGTKLLTDDEKKFKVFGVIIHELCHLAICLAFMNRNFDPFPMGESQQKTKFVTEVMTQCKQREDFEGIVANVFRSYLKNIQDSEMIVTVPQMLMQYHENKKKIEELETVFNELFRYSKEVVEPELVKALPTLKMLKDEDQEIKIDHLTEPMIAKILHSPIIFQGEKTTFFDMIGTDYEILKLLTSEDIRKILIKNEVIEISEICELNLKYGVIERSFVDPKIYKKVSSKFKDWKGHRKPEEYNQLINENKKGFEKIRDEVRASKVFLLSDNAGSGKTTSLKIFVRKLKKENKNFWVSFVNLRKSGKFFEKHKEETEKLEIRQVQNILTEIICPKSKVEEKIFAKLFSEGRVILLFDGVDEICPKYSQIFMKILTILMENLVKNEIWISTRPQQAEKLRILLSTTGYRFTPFTEEEIKKFGEKILKINKISDKNELLMLPHVIYMLTSGLMYKTYIDIDFQDNPLIIEMIIELYIENVIKIDLQSVFGIFSAIIDRQRQKLGEKVPTEDRDPISKFTVWDVHQVLALMVIYGDHPRLYDLSIMKKWQKEKKNWTSDMVQRYGFVVVNFDDFGDSSFPDSKSLLENRENLSSSIDFTHRTFAEYFVVIFFINFIFDDHSGTDCGEIDRIMDLFIETVIANAEGFEIIHHFFFNYLKNEVKQNFDEKIQISVTKKIPKIHKELENSEKGLYINFEFQKFFNFTEFVANDLKISKKLWGVDQGYSILRLVLSKENDENFRGSTYLAELCFGPNWHEIFNKSGQDLIKDEEIEKFQTNYIGNEPIWKEEKNLLKLLDLVDENFNKNEIQKIYKKLNFYNMINDTILKEIILKMEVAVSRQTFAHKCMSTLNYRPISGETLVFIYEKVEKVLQNDRKMIRKFLFFNQQHEHEPPLYKIFRSDSAEVFSVVRQFYTKYKNSWEEIQNLFVNCNTYDFLSKMQCSYFREYFEFIQEVFETKKSKITFKIEKYIENRENFIKDFQQNLQNVHEFLSWALSDEEKISKIFSVVKS